MDNKTYQHQTRIGHQCQALDLMHVESGEAMCSAGVMGYVLIT